MTKSALVLCADGAEDIELITIIDVLRRAELSVTVASVTGSSVCLGHGCLLTPDQTGLPEGVFDAVVLPGGSKAAKTFSTDPSTQALIKEYAQAGKLTAAICASPAALAAAGVLKGKRATCYPGMEGKLREGGVAKAVEGDDVVVDGNIVTSRGPGTAIPFALKLTEILAGRDVAEKVRQQLLYKC